MAIICGYAGVGKSWFSSQTKDSIEVPSMPYAWLLPKPDNQSEQEIEQSKGAFYQHLPNPQWPMNMVLAALKAEKEFKNVVIPTVENVIKILSEDYGRECILIYPEAGLEEEYRQRYIRRGNNEMFLSLFMDDMEERLSRIQKLKGKHIRLSAGQYLMDVKHLIDECSTKQESIPVENSVIEEIEKRQKEEMNDLSLVGFGRECRYAYRIADVNNEDSLRFFYNVGILSYQLHLHKPVIYSIDVRMSDLFTWIETPEEFMEMMKEEADWDL